MTSLAFYLIILRDGKIIVPPPASVQFSHVWVMSDSLQPHGLQHARLPCLNTWSLLKLMSMSRWCRPTMSSSAVPFSCRQSFSASGSFPVSQSFTSGGQSITTSLIFLKKIFQKLNIPNLYHHLITQSIIRFSHFFPPKYLSQLACSDCRQSQTDKSFSFRTSLPSSLLSP